MKRNSFDRSTEIELSNATLEVIRDKEPLVEGWERVYTAVSVVDETSAPDKIRFGTGGEDRHKWHEEEQAPAADVYYTACREYHCRRHDRGIVGIYGGGQADKIIVNWHGYDKVVRER